MAKVTYQEFLKMLADPDVPESELAKYVTIDREASGPLNPVLAPNPTQVAMTMDELEMENAMRIGNSYSRWRRQRAFNKRKKAGDKSPVLVSEGDSWFQFPILIDDVVDHLKKDYMIWSLGAAGDTAQNMVFGGAGKGKTEYMQALDKNKKTVKGFLFSAAGNDVIGEDATGKPVLLKILKRYNGTKDPASHIDHSVLADTMFFLKNAYTTVINTVRSAPGFETLPIIIHGYDYAIPGGKNDSRNPLYAKPDQWLGGPMRKNKIVDPGLQRDIIRLLIDALYDTLYAVAGDEKQTHVHVVNVRNTLKKKSDWNDEIHGTSAGFGRVAAKFRNVLRKVIK